MVLGTFARKNSKIFWFFARLFVPLQPIKAAQMVELVDTRDLKSLDHCGRTGSSPVPGTKKASPNGGALLLLKHTFRKP